ncbi:hypothetical protein [Brucella intermedia]|uniref:hypothetical protein n=1 Tax=Brucella intermedia TaxID=94625 RepID=UPI00124E5439|nr:hypothetical protein [Brucella intermedia]KAB2721478.1 hypothetical protein F9L02_23240 [Brucella intermedia]
MPTTEPGNARNRRRIDGSRRTNGPSSKAWSRKLASRESLLASEVMVVEAEEELRQQDLAKQQKEIEVLANVRAEGDAGLAGTDKASVLSEGQTGQEQSIIPDGLRSATGILLQTGQALYRPNDKDNMTSYAEIRTDEGKVERLWGVTMPRAIIEAQAKVGDRVSIVLDSRETVEKVIAVVDEKTGAQRYEKRDVERNRWTVTVHRPEEDKHLPTPEKQQLEEKAPVEPGRSRPASLPQPGQGRFQLDREEAERFTGKAWSDMNPLEKARESSRQKEAAREVAGGSAPYQLDREEAERFTGKPWSGVEPVGKGPRKRSPARCCTGCKWGVNAIPARYGRG